MKRLLLIVSLILMAGAVSAQNSWANPIKVMGGMTLGRNGTGINSTFVLDANSKIKKIDSLTVDNMTTPTGYAVVIAGDTLNPIYSTAGTVDNDDYYTKLQPDTVQHTANYTVGASDWGKDQHCNKATSIIITLPTNLTDWPIGGVMNFYGNGAGIMVFKGGVIISDKDSIATSRKGQAVSVKKLAASKYFLIGALTD